tara:strand:+ start:329 stop:652 length:324 start_codon:yes stop_codon:yes gene_type:complete
LKHIADEYAEVIIFFIINACEYFFFGESRIGIYLDELKDETRNHQRYEHIIFKPPDIKLDKKGQYGQEGERGKLNMWKIKNANPPVIHGDEGNEGEGDGYKAKNVQK